MAPKKKRANDDDARKQVDSVKEGIKGVEELVAKRDYAGLCEVVKGNHGALQKYLSIGILLHLRGKERVELELGEADERLLSLWRLAKERLDPNAVENALMAEAVECEEAKELIRLLLRIPGCRRFLALLVADYQVDDEAIQFLLQLPFDSLAGVPLSPAEAEAVRARRLHRLQLILFEMGLLPELALTNGERAGQADYLRSQLGSLAPPDLARLAERVGERYRADQVVEDLVRRFARPAHLEGPWRSHPNLDGSWHSHPNLEGPWLSLVHFQLEATFHFQQRHETAIENLIERALLAHPVKVDAQGKIWLRGRGSHLFLSVSSLAGNVITLDCQDLPPETKALWLQTKNILAMRITADGCLEHKVLPCQAISSSQGSLHLKTAELPAGFNLVGNLLWEQSHVLGSILAQPLAIGDEGVLACLLGQETIPLFHGQELKGRTLLIGTRLPDPVHHPYLVRPAAAADEPGSLEYHEGIRWGLLNAILEACRAAGIPEEEFGWSCEAAEALWRRHFLPRWTAYQELPDEVIREAEGKLPIACLPGESLEQAWSRLSSLFGSLAAYRPFDYLPTAEAKLDYLLGHYAKVIMLRPADLLDAQLRKRISTSPSVVLIDDRLTVAQRFLACAMAPQAQQIFAVERLPAETVEHRVAEGVEEEPVEGVFQNLAQAEAAVELYAKLDPKPLLLTPHPAQALLMEEIGLRRGLPLVCGDLGTANCQDEVILVACRQEIDPRIVAEAARLAYRRFHLIHS